MLYIYRRVNFPVLGKEIFFCIYFNVLKEVKNFSCALESDV